MSAPARAPYGTVIPNPQTIGHAASPAADDGASPWAVLGMALGCAALLGGAGPALVHRARRARRPVLYPMGVGIECDSTLTSPSGAVAPHAAPFASQQARRQ